jgi:hypothetical protein
MVDNWLVTGGLLLGGLAIALLLGCLVIAVRAAMAGTPNALALRGIHVSFAFLMIAVAAVIASIDLLETRLAALVVSVTALFPLWLAARTRMRTDRSRGADPRIDGRKVS